MKPRLLLVGNEPAYFLSHRLPLAQAARRAGYDVHVATRATPESVQIRALGFTHHEFPLTRSGMNPFAELRTLASLIALFRRLRPDIVHLVTIKPVLYGGIAARLARVRGAVAVVTGLGYMFVSEDRRARLLKPFVALLYRIALGHRNMRVIFQNDTDRRVLQDLGAIEPRRTVLVPGSGVDLGQYVVRPEPAGVPAVLMASRLLFDKGVVEYVGAARLLREQGVRARFMLAGDFDPNPACVSQGELESWREAGDVELLGFRNDIPALLAAANIVVLPSYREGLPKVLVEAGACGRAIVTTDVPGCRDAIEPDVSGLIVPVRDVAALAAAIRRLIEDADLRGRMGAAGRALAEREFGIEKIVGAQLRVYDEIRASS
jgi:glycosyltransferase involved in cell wall biosynthesis